MAGDTIPISKTLLGGITVAIAVFTFAWNIITGISEQKAKIERLEYQVSLGEAKDREIQEKYELLLSALNEQRVEFVRLRSAIKEKQ